MTGSVHIMQTRKERKQRREGEREGGSWREREGQGENQESDVNFRTPPLGTYSL